MMSKKSHLTLESGSKYNLLDYSQNAYHDFFKKSDNKIGFSSLKPNSISQPSIIKNFSTKRDISKTSIFVNNQKISISASASKKSELGNSIYGKRNTFSIIKED